MARTPRRLVAVAVTAGLLLGACGDDADPIGAEAEVLPAPALAPAAAEAAVATHAELVAASYDDAVAGAEALQAAVDAFLAAPSDAGLATARDAWVAARVAYRPTEVFRFTGGPIDDPEDGPEGRINAWPLDEAYLDAVAGDPDTGLVNDVAGVPEITTDVLVAANERDGETNISTGYHAIEFLLWGQDTSATGPGARPVTDYTTAAHADRRGTTLRLLAQLLVDDLRSVADQWDADTGRYRTTFVADPDAAIAKIFRGMGALAQGELAGERLVVAYDTQDQEDEHSCFSDTTLGDVVGNAEGIRTAYLADRPGLTGPSLADAVAAVDPDLDAELRTALDAVVTAARALPGPFDQLILGEDDAPGRVALLALIEQLQDLGDQIERAGRSLGYDVDISLA